MITTKTLTVKTTNQTQDHYRNLGYIFKCNDYININIEHISLNSHYKVNIQCDTCNKEYIHEFRGVNMYINKLYACKSCKTKELIKLGKRKIFNKETNQKIANNVKIKMKDENYKKEFYNKIKQTKLKKYNDENYNNQEKRKLTMFKRYGKFFNNHNKAILTMLKRYNKYFNNQEKKILTTFKKYGVYHTNHVPYIFLKIQKSAFQLKTHNETNLKYRGSYEKDFLDFCYLNKININNFDGNIKYSKNSVYYPDFFIKELNLIIEIKSDYTYNIDYWKNKLKEMSCLKNNYNFIFIINKDYSKFLQIINNI
jgi:hypothetical protein